MRKILLSIMGLTTILGCVVIAWAVMTGESATVIVSKVAVGNGITMYKLDLLGYIKNIENTLPQIKLIGTTAPNPPKYDFGDVLKALKTIVNMFLYSINQIIFVLKILILTPIKFIAYVIVVLLSLVGLNTSSLGNNTFILYNINIPYIKYI